MPRKQQLACHASNASLLVPHLCLPSLPACPPPRIHLHLPQIYPLPLQSIEADEEALLPRRKALHRLLGLPPNRPLLRVANAVDFSAGGSAGGGGLAAALMAGGTGGRPRLQVRGAKPPPGSSLLEGAAWAALVQLLGRCFLPPPLCRHCPTAGRTWGAAAAAGGRQRAPGAGLV